MAGELADERARQRVRTDLDQNFVVEAGAGTGKTRLLVDRIEGLVASGRTRLRKVVAITFTEKAAAELRVRVRERIERRLARGDDSQGRFRVALADLEIAPISTIHAFAADLLRERPVEAGVDPAFTVVEELPTSLFRTEAWDRWLESQKDAGDGPLPELIERHPPRPPAGAWGRPAEAPGRGNGSMERWSPAARPRRLAQYRAAGPRGVPTPRRDRLP